MFIIRAGILNNLRHNYDQIYPKILKELLYRNNFDKIIENFIIIISMEEMNLFNTKNIYQDFLEFDEVFPNDTLNTLNLLLNRYEPSQILTACTYYPDIFCHIKKIQINEWKNVSQFKGYRMEKNAKEFLNNIGIIIEDIKKKYIILEKDNFKIKLYGRPDGIIKESKGNIFKKNTIIEIKYKGKQGKQNKNLNNQYKYQLVSYALIYESDILYIKYFDDLIELQLYKYKDLIKYWEDISDMVFLNCKKIYERFLSFYDNENEIKDFINQIE